MKSLHLCLKKLVSIFQVVSECVFAVASVRAREGRVEGEIAANQGVTLTKGRVPAMKGAGSAYRELVSGEYNCFNSGSNQGTNLH